MHIHMQLCFGVGLVESNPGTRDLTAQWLLDKSVEGSISGVCGGFRGEEIEREREVSIAKADKLLLYVFLLIFRQWPAHKLEVLDKC